MKALAGLAVCLGPLACFVLNPTAAIGILDWALSRRHSTRRPATVAETASPATTVQPSESPPPTAASTPERSQTNGTSALLHSAIAESIGATRLSAPANANSQKPAIANGDEHNIELLQRVRSLLKSGQERFGRIPGYSATFIKRERIGDEVTDLTTMQLKVRHQPFAVYLKWVEGPGLGREILYPDGANDGSMLVRMGGLKGRLIPAFRIDASGAIAMNQSRYPVAKAGILGLAESMIAHREQELQNQVYARARQEADADVDGRRCAVYLFEFDNRERSPDYRKSIQYLDLQWNVPLHVENYGWPEPGQHLEGAALDEATLIEYYKYSNIVTNGLSDDDFSPSNPEYRFRR